MGSSRKSGSKILGILSPLAAKDFLVRLGNLADDSGAAAQLLTRFPEMFPASIHGASIRAFRRELRRAWDSQDARKRDWYLHSLRRGHAAETRAKLPRLSHDDFDYLTDPLPEITPFEAALYYFQTKIGDLAKHCGHVDCPAPYFIADKRWQKFCSEECAGPANRESKRKWWNENRAKEVSR